MLFLEEWFWIFAAGAVPIVWLAPPALKVYALLAASAVFHYHFAGPAGMAPIMVLGALTYLAGIRRPGSGWIPVVGVAVVGALAFYKYAGLVLEGVFQLASMFGAATGTTDIAWRAPAIPLGISFFAFEFVHYLYEVRVGGRVPIRHPAHFAVFAIFFPCLAAGPIKRFPDFVPQLDAIRLPPMDDVWWALRRIIQGLFRKVCIADLLVEYVRVLEGLPRFSAPAVAALAVLQGLRIYHDFGGYSDIAIGLSRLLNIRVPENFDRPYRATSLQDFWRRWHMSLSSWIRDYVYIPLGGNRAHRALNLLLAMSLCGLWHGAAWHFALWGTYHGLGLALEAGLRRVLPAQMFAHGPGRWARWALCYTYVTYGWLLFFYPVPTVARMTAGLAQWG